jgi:hypothetical protein
VRRRLLLLLALLLPATDLCGQELEERKAAALDKPFVHAARWLTDFTTAKAEAKRTKKPIFAYFSRSYRP